MGFLTFGIIAVVAASLIPAIINWSKTHRCPKCGKWFCLEYHSFVVTDKTIGHNRERSGGGYRSGWRGGFFGGNSHTRDDPFIREWGEARYICRACGRHISIMTHRDR
jgi:DNA-directed RNA polymerase subunit RPC12/RpoP